MCSEYKAPAGSTIFQACKDALKIAVTQDEAVKLEFNGTYVFCYPASCVEDLIEKYYFQRN